jgi:multicomponent Na+:H+ antiporter subunit G
VAREVAGVLALAGSAFVLLAGIGVVRLRDVYARMHSATKASTIGIALIGGAAAVALAEGRAKTALTVAFIFITAPSAAHLVGRAAYRAEGIDVDLETRDDLAQVMEKAHHGDDTDDGPAPSRGRQRRGS